MRNLFLAFTYHNAYNPNLRGASAEYPSPLARNLNRADILMSHAVAKLKAGSRRFIRLRDEDGWGNHIVCFPARRPHFVKTHK